MTLVRLGLMTVGITLVALAVIGAAYEWQAQQPDGGGATAMASAQATPTPGQFLERSRHDFRIRHLSTYEFAPSQATRDLASRHTGWNGLHKRVWYEVVPEGRSDMPLVILLHGSGRDGLSLVEMWKDVAAREGVALLAPDGIGNEWSFSEADAPFLAMVVDRMAQAHGIDRNRVYLFGHSAGAVYGQYLLNRVEGPWSAAVLHAGYAPTKIMRPPMTAKPFRLYLGTKDHIFAVENARTTAKTLATMGHDTELMLIPGHTHWLYQVGPQIAADAWMWLDGLPRP